MGELEIQNKLRSFLIKHDPLTEEAHVVYVMVEIRKIIEQENDGPYPLLKFYCDWCVHSKKDKITKQIKRTMEVVHEDILLLQASGGPFETNQEIYKFVEMENLRNEMDKFLQTHGLPDNLIIKFDGWENFINLFTKVLIDQPLENPHEKIKSFAFVPVSSQVNTAAIKIVYQIKEAEYADFSMQRGRPITN